MKRSLTIIALILGLALIAAGCNGGKGGNGAADEMDVSKMLAGGEIKKTCF